MFFYLPFLLVGILIYSSLDFHRFFIQALVASCSVKSWGREEGGEQHSERFFNQ
jgi:flagellar biosynthesis protein FliR